MASKAAVPWILVSLKDTLGLLSPQAPSGTGVSREALSGLLIMGAGGGSLIVLSLLLLRKKKPYGTISHGVVEVRGRHRGEGRS